MLNFSSLINKSVSVLRICFSYLTKLCFSNKNEIASSKEKNFNLIKNSKSKPNDINYDENRVESLNEPSSKKHNDCILLFKSSKKSKNFPTLDTTKNSNKKSKKLNELTTNLNNNSRKMADCSCENFRSKLSTSIECLADTLKSKTRFMRKPRREEYEGPLSKMTRRLSLKSRDIQERFINSRQDKEKRKSLSSLADSLNDTKRDSHKSNQNSKNIYPNSMNNTNNNVNDKNSAKSKNSDSSTNDNSIKKFNINKPIDISKFKIRESYLDEIESEYVRPKPKI
jgi:hypothetical protein